MNYDEIINEIKSNLTGDPEKDVPYLMDKSDSLKGHEFEKELSREIGLMIYNMLPSEAKDDLENVIKNHQVPVEDVIKEAFELVQKNEFTKAEVLLRDTIVALEENFSFEDDSVNRYYHFNEPIEEILTSVFFKDERTVRRLPQDYPALYGIYGAVLFELGNLDEAKEYLERALHWNPLYMKNRFEYIETFKKSNEMDRFYELSKDALNYAYRKEHIARCYRNIGYYFVEKEEYDLAVSLFHLSIAFENTDKVLELVQSELYYIMDKAGRVIERREIEVIKEKLDEKGIIFAPSINVIGILSQIIDLGKDTKNKDLELYALNYLYGLTEGEDLRKRIDELNPVN